MVMTDLLFKNGTSTDVKNTSMQCKPNEPHTPASSETAWAMVAHLQKTWWVSWPWLDWWGHLYRQTLRGCSDLEALTGIALPLFVSAEQRSLPWCSPSPT